ncbi:class I fructose-bisphosphate aldolase [Sulfolobus acidocaldarius]|uniref:Aldolase n=3 Tax=Sulfolobus acidocaldarius TaxID=2285 RepID=A0A0U3GNT2_9CREN|nr:class I fructose-bisphosphate aldolase [Sulfolobus acidocaldarius]AGE70394.1 fructose-bisphosphate aldolase [Sulfolobus acidocaldarius N8]AGE72668.1 fructose-bisphosphate aldolase [Sulfolobus acidocaldarius Ron12/I]ALU29214.1 aldolase [Sulfolobus acidocaldarius]ALU31941.1 aldolase [Sulfolobus acidocaldarius]WCM34398.1 aldolase [Sulfolobus acidocaldarius DSM 639]
MIGFEIRMKRLFERGKAFVVALDHGLVMGPLKGIERVAEVVRKISFNGPDALQMTPGMLKIVKENFFSRGSPMLIARLDTANVWRSDYKRFESGYYSQIYSVKDAIEAGADAVVTYFVVGYGDDRVEGYNIESLAKARREANDYGIPFIIEPLFVSPDNPDSVKDPKLVKYVTRLASEIGADILKVDYTGDKNSFREVVDLAFAPILIRGGPKTKNDTEFLQMLKDAIQAGASGITVGRNLWQSKEPDKMARAISGLVHEGKDIGEILKILG